MEGSRAAIGLKPNVCTNWNYLTWQMECYSYPLNVFHIFIWKTAPRQCLESLEGSFEKMEHETGLDIKQEFLSSSQSLCFAVRCSSLMRKCPILTICHYSSIPAATRIFYKLAVSLFLTKPHLGYCLFLKVLVGHILIESLKYCVSQHLREKKEKETTSYTGTQEDT